MLDYDAHCHDHPWSFVSLILKGSYAELWYDAPNYNRANLTTYSVGDFAYHPRTDIHKIEYLSEPVWTLVFAFGTYKMWGYRLWAQEDNGYLAWMDHQTYRQAKRDNLLAHEEHTDNEPKVSIKINEESVFINTTNGSIVKNISNEGSIFISASGGSRISNVHIAPTNRKR